MAVKKVGQDETKKRKATCKNCGAKLEFYPKDVQHVSLVSMCEYAGGYDYVRCTECKQEVKVK